MTDELKGFILEEIDTLNDVINQRKEYYEKCKLQLLAVPNEPDEKIRINKTINITNKLSCVEGEIMAYDNIIKALTDILNKDNPDKHKTAKNTFCKEK